MITPVTVLSLGEIRILKTHFHLCRIYIEKHLLSKSVQKLIWVEFVADVEMSSLASINVKSAQCVLFSSLVQINR